MVKIRKKVRVYQTPLERNHFTYRMEQQEPIIHEKKNFYKVLFANPLVEEVIERPFLFTDNATPMALIKSFIPDMYIKRNLMTSSNLELKIDDFYQIDKIKKEYSLTWPTSEEAEVLQIIGDGQIMIEKQFFLDSDNHIIRYEEEVSCPETYIFEE
ncbi:hypothetical protein [Candidatus Enterococcus murrayae]|uniref:UbiC transcription regulator-associated domain-containing protein n=1 Tax=Candidatus Enterococcus murrayae TaxID=2815321 RepID=A0ABS3HKG7_9ENTE|nr:hypothetical protein [Enterococcus sp. MJM16]MBO0453512.1 hypothetical protein [Enterococcus sp. MJM16]